MTFEGLIDSLGDRTFLALGGAVVGFAFGIVSQRSRFCTRSAFLELVRLQAGERLAEWLFAFSVAILATQCLILLDLFDTGAVRQLGNRGSLSGALVGGLAFGGGMVLCRACAARILVLSAAGNLRTLAAGAVFAVTVLLLRDGVLAPVRAAVTGWWPIDAEWLDGLAVLGVGHAGGAAFGFVGVLLAVPVAAIIGVLCRFWLLRYLASPLYLDPPAEEGQGT